MNKTYKLTEKQRMFYICYYTPGSETFGNAQESARRSGYKGNDNTLRQIGHKMVISGNAESEKARIQADMAEKLDYDAARCASMQQAAYDLAMSIKQPAAASTAGTAIAKLFALDKDASADKPEQARELSANDIAELQAMSKRLNEADVARPTIHKLHESA